MRRRYTESTPTLLAPTACMTGMPKKEGASHLGMSWPSVLRAPSLPKGKIKSLSRQPKASLGAHQGAGRGTETTQAKRPRQEPDLRSEAEAQRGKAACPGSHSKHGKPARAQTPVWL